MHIKAAWRYFSRAAGRGTVRGTLAKMAALLNSLKAAVAWETFEMRRLAPLCRERGREREGDRDICIERERKREKESERDGERKRALLSRLNGPSRGEGLCGARSRRWPRS